MLPAILHTLQFFTCHLVLWSSPLLLPAFSTFLSESRALARRWPVEQMVLLAKKSGCFSPESGLGVVTANN